MADDNFILISSQQMLERFISILLTIGFTKERADECAAIFTANSVDGIYTHGVNRFPRFVQYVKDGYVLPGATPSLKNKFGAIEQWDGNLGPGPLNAVHATKTAMNLAQQHGIGCVALANTNHWMRGGTYGWQAAKKGFVFIVFFALFIAVSRIFMYRYVIKRDFSEMNLYRILLQGLILFLIFLVPGLLLVRWYYRMKHKKKI